MGDGTGSRAMKTPVRLRRRAGFEVALGSYQGAGSGQAYSRHFHEEIVLGANLKGDEWLKLDGKSLVAREGDITIYNPAQIQEGGSLSEDSEWRFLTFYVEGRFAHETLYGTSGELEFDAALLTCPQTLALFQAAARCFEHGELDALDEILALLLGQLAARIGAVAGQPALARTIGPADRRLRRVAERLHASLDAPSSLTALAEEAGISVEHLVRSFTGAFGLPPMAWVMQKRLGHARRLLRQGLAPAEIAAALGFADQSHLHRAFKRVSGMTPARFARAAGR